MIPVQITINNKEVTAYLKSVSGASSTTMFHLMYDNYFIGQLFYTSDGWQFGSNKYTELEKQAEYFGSVVSAWLDSHE